VANLQNNQETEGGENDQQSLMQAEQVPSCKNRQILQSRLRADVKVYADAISALQQSMGKGFEKAHLRVESARRAYQVARKKLTDHIETHGCA
jgi:hypothetical protein